MSSRNQKQAPPDGKLKSLTKPGSPLSSHIRPGLQALKSTDKSQISSSPPNYTTDSIDLDTALKAAEHNENRWDYWIGTSDEIVAVEVHPAKPSEVTVMIKKKTWAVQKAQEHLRMPNIKQWYWIASGSTQISKTTTEYRRMAQAGILLAGTHLNLSKPK